MCELQEAVEYMNDLTGNLDELPKRIPSTVASPNTSKLRHLLFAMLI